MRFKYISEWYSISLNEICDFYKGNGLSKSDLSVDGLPCILYGELYTTYKKEIIDSIISKTNVKLPNPFKSQKNDVIIPGSGEDPIDIAVARAIVNDDILLGGDLNVLRPHSNYSGPFLSYQLNGRRRFEIAKKAQGKSIVHLHNSDLKDIKVYTPHYDEQLKIVDFLKLIDQRIELQNKIIEDLNSLENHIINSFLDVEGELYYVRDIAEIGRGRVISSIEISKQLRPTYPVFSSQTSNDGIMGYLDTYDFNGEYVTWTTDGANAGTVYYRNGKFNCTNVCGTLKINDMHDAFYVSKTLNILSKKYVSINLANPKLMNNTMGGIKIKLPPLKKQKELSGILRKFEEKIQIESKSLNLLKLQKNYLLENLFI